MKNIRILDAKGGELAKLKTENPDWSFDQFCRNRDLPGATWVEV
jgi:hypothetical protein